MSDTDMLPLNKRFPNPLRPWVFTVFHYTPEDVARVKALVSLSTRVAVGEEVCPDTGTPHLQGYVRFEKAVRAAWVQAHIAPGCHIEPRRGTETQASTYALKDGKVLVDHGVDCDAVDRKRSRDDETDEVISEIEKGESYGRIRNRHKKFVFRNRRQVADYMHDEKRLKDFSNYQPMCSDDRCI